MPPFYCPLEFPVTDFTFGAFDYTLPDEVGVSPVGGSTPGTTTASLHQRHRQPLNTADSTGPAVSSCPTSPVADRPVGSRGLLSGTAGASPTALDDSFDASGRVTPPSALRSTGLDRPGEGDTRHNGRIPCWLLTTLAPALQQGTSWQCNTSKGN